MQKRIFFKLIQFYKIKECSKKWHKAREVQETVGKFYKDKQKRGSTRFKVWCFRLNSQKKYRISFVRTSIQQKPKNIALCLNHKPNNQ